MFATIGLAPEEVVVGEREANLQLHHAPQWRVVNDASPVLGAVAATSDGRRLVTHLTAPAGQGAKNNIIAPATFARLPLA